MTLRYRIKYTWPSGKVRYRQGNRLCSETADADTFTLIEASGILKQAKSARIIWDIKATKERIR